MRTFQEFVSEMTYGRGRGPIGRADKNNSPRYRNLGSPTPEQEKESKSRADKAAADAVAKLRRARAREMKEELELDEGMTMKDFKKQRSRQKQRDKREALKTSPNRRKDIHTDRLSPERAARHRANVDPDFEGNDERNYPGGKLNPKKVRKAKALGELGEQNVQELFITKLTPEQKRKKKVETLIRLMQHAKDPAADVAKTKKEDYELDETIRNPESRKKLRAIMDREVVKGDKSKGQNPRRKYLTKTGDQAFGLLIKRDETGSKDNPVRSRGGTNAPSDERVGKGPHRAGNAKYWAGVAGPTRDRGAGNKAARRSGKSVPNTRDDD